MREAVIEPRQGRRWFQFSLSTLLVLMLVASAYMAGRVGFHPRQWLGPPDLAGQWKLTLPAGFEYDVTLQSVDDNKFRFAPQKLNMSGVYAQSEGELKIVAPDDVRLTGFVWKVLDDDKLVLVGEPGTAKTGSSYLGATLSRPEEKP